MRIFLPIFLTLTLIFAPGVVCPAFALRTREPSENSRRRSVLEEALQTGTEEPIKWRAQRSSERMRSFWNKYFSGNAPLYMDTFVELMFTTIEWAAPLIKDKEMAEIGTGYVIAAAVDVLGAKRGVGTAIAGDQLIKGRHFLYQIGLADRVILLGGELFAPLHGQCFDVVLSNTENWDMAERFIQTAGIF